MIRLQSNEETEQTKSRRRTDGWSASSDSDDSSDGAHKQSSVKAALISAAKDADPTGTSYAVLVCQFVDDGEGGRGDASADRELVLAQVRVGDTIANVDLAEIVLVAPGLQDEQDAAGVAYRLLATKSANPSAHSQVVQMSVGIAVANGQTPVDEPIPAARSAAEKAAESGPGEFRLNDLRR